MRHRLFMLWAAFRWVLLMFLIAPVMEAPLVAHLSQPVKPIKTWSGNASWYGPGFNGRKTANGEIFSTEALTAAHPNLPFGSLVQDRKSTRLNSSHSQTSYAVFCLKKKIHVITRTASALFSRRKSSRVHKTNLIMD